MASAPLKIVGVKRGQVILLIKEIREIFGFGLREAKRLTDDPFPHLTPEIDQDDMPDVAKRLQALGAVFDEIPTFKPSNPKDVWDRLGEDDLL